jgi:hypothetical protein
MTVKVNDRVAHNRAGRRPSGSRPVASNTAAAVAAWEGFPPHWIRLLASACDNSSQSEVAAKLRKSGPYISRIINNKYPGDMAEAEQLVRGAFGGEDVICPLWGPIPLSSCMRARRRKGHPRNNNHRLHQSHCPKCPINTDHPSEGGEPPCT